MRDDVCNANGKSDAQKAEMLRVLAHYGTVEDFEGVVNAERAKYQQVIDNQTRQLEAIKDQALTEDEIAMVKAYRGARSAVVAKHEAIEQECRQTIARLEETLTSFKNKIIAVVGD
jgi:hypothetical protein